MLLQKFLSRKISPEKSLDFLSQKSVLQPAQDTCIAINPTYEQTQMSLRFTHVSFRGKSAFLTLLVVMNSDAL